MTTTKGEAVPHDEAGAPRPLWTVEAPSLAPRVTRAVEIAGYIRELIITGYLRSPEPANIDALARDLKTSPTPVREALQVLKGEGFVVATPGRGFQIAPLTLQDVRDMFMMQAFIAGELASRTAQNATPELLTAITSLQTALRESNERGDAKESEHLNFEIHRLLNKAAGAPKLLWLMGVVVQYAPRVFYSAIPGWHDASIQDHEAIIEAIKNRDPEAARTAMVTHIEHAGRLLVADLEERGFGRSTPAASEA